MLPTQYPYIIFCPRRLQGIYIGAASRPFYTLMVKVVDDATGNELENANVSLSDARNRNTDAQGNVEFLSFPQEISITASKFGWIAKTENTTVSSDLQVSIRLFWLTLLLPKLN